MADEAETLCRLAEQALADGEEAEVETRLSRWLQAHSGDAVAWHWCAMLRRSLDRRDEAIEALDRALHLDPNNAGIALALAQVTLEAGLPATRLYEQAIRLAPGNAGIRLGLLAARHAQGDGERGLAEIDAMLAANPGWAEGHRQFAQMSSLMGHADRALSTLDRSLDRFPQGDGLRKLAIDLLVEAERYSETLERAEHAIALRGALEPFVLLRAIGLDETGRSADAAAVFEELGPAQSTGDAVWRVRHHLRTADPVHAAREIEPWLPKPGAEAAWPYAQTIWGLTGDDRLDWLEASGQLCKVIDLDPAEIGLDEVVPLLRKLHTGAGRFLDQSVRGGTQTEGALFSRIEPAIARLRERLRTEVAAFVSELPPEDAGHPTLGQLRGRRIRFSGSWSVRLSDAGFHAPHHHPQGWISSALYLSVPEVSGAEGHLELGGAPAGLGLDLAPRRLIEPRSGRLVLFPSWLWHGTMPFARGERMTVAFDIARA